MGAAIGAGGFGVRLVAVDPLTRRTPERFEPGRELHSQEGKEEIEGGGRAGAPARSRPAVYQSTRRTRQASRTATSASATTSPNHTPMAPSEVWKPST